MPPRLKRYQNTGQLHYVTFTCYRRQKYLESASARDVFEQTLESVRRWYGFCVVGYVVMPEHIHLLGKRTGTFHPGRRSADVEAGHFAQAWRLRRREAFLAETILRFQRFQRPKTNREAAVHAPQPGKTRFS